MTRILRAIWAPLVMIVCSVVWAVFHPQAGLIALALGVALLVAKWADWYFYPRLRFRVWPRMRP